MLLHAPGESARPIARMTMPPRTPEEDLRRSAAGFTLAIPVAVRRIAIWASGWLAGVVAAWAIVLLVGGSVVAPTIVAAAIAAVVLGRAYAKRAASRQG